MINSTCFHTSSTIYFHTRGKGENAFPPLRKSGGGNCIPAFELPTAVFHSYWQGKCPSRGCCE